MNNTFSQVPEGHLVASLQCWNCKHNFIMSVSAVGYTKWKRGMLIQEAIPEIPPEQREMLMSKTCPDCWKALLVTEPPAEPTPTTVNPNP